MYYINTSMIVIYNKFIPFKGYIAINIFGVLFAREEYRTLKGWMMTHELIHTRQMTEMLFVFFYVWYAIEWLIRMMQYRDARLAYLNISFEREAYINQFDGDYLKTRKFFSFTKYL